MEGLVFVVVIVLFSILEGVLRKQKARQGLSGPTSEEGQYDPALEDEHRSIYDAMPSYNPPGSDSDRLSYDDRPSYDDQPSYDDRPSYDDQSDDDGIPGEPLPRYSGRYGAVSRPSSSAPETMTPKELWDEIAGLASGRAARSPAPARPPRSETRAVARQASYQPAPKQEHMVHRAHVGYGTDPSSRAPSEQDGLDPLAQRLGADAQAVHAIFEGGDRHLLRQAIILQEVLGPPAAFREDPYEPQ